MKRVKAVREQRGWSLTDAATAAGLDRITVHRVEHCIVRARRSTIVTLARAYGISSRKLWEYHVADQADRTLLAHEMTKEPA
jgi:transcriptional regulator with XRE-family HTH domain